MPLNHSSFDMLVASVMEAVSNSHLPSLLICKTHKLVKENHAWSGEHSGDNGKVSGNGRINCDMVKQCRVAEKCSGGRVNKLAREKH